MDICRRQFGACILGALAGQTWGAPLRPKLTVLVVVEQLRADALDLAWPQLDPGGFRKLADDGVWFTSCQHLSSTFPSCGIANLATGAWPAQHGIVADSWYDHVARAVIRASDESLLATTLVSQAVAEPVGMRVSVVATSRAHASLFAGSPRAKLYYWNDAGRFEGSGPAPDWLAEFNASNGPDIYRDEEWRAEHAAAEAPPLRTLRYDPARPQDFAALYKASAFGQNAIFEMATALVSHDKLGQGSTSDLLCILDGSSSLLGYEAGAQSQLMNQMVLHLDVRLQKLLDYLTTATGKSGFNLVVCAAHGIPPEPKDESRARMAVDGNSIAQAVESALKITGRHVEKYVYPFLYLDRSATVNTAEAVRRLAAEAALAQPAVADWYTAGGACSTSSDWQKRFQNSFHLKRSGDVMLSYRPEYVEDFGAKRGISYGSLYNYDTRVPLFLYGPQFNSGIFDTPVQAVDVAPTLARVLGIGEPSSAVGRVLGEALFS